MSRKKTVLIVDDSKSLVDSYSKALEKAGYSTLKASNGNKALNCMSKNLGKIDLVLLDLILPDVDGLDVLRTVNDNIDKYGTIPIIVLTNMSLESVIKDVFSLGAVSYLLKTDMGYNSLVREVKKFLG